MQDVCAPFAGKKITVLGLGLLGRGVGDVEFLAKCGAEILVTDKKTEAELAESVSRLKEKYSDIVFHLGDHQASDFTDCDMVLKAAGVMLDSPEIAAAKRAGVPVYMSTALFAKYAMDIGATIVGVTGTRGKSTVTQMIHHALVKAGKRPHLGGNIRGVSTLAILPEVRKGDIAVLELDSWQLQGFGDLKLSPHISVFTNLMPDHQNYYKDTEEYFSDKANIFRFQKKGDVCIAGRSISERIGAAVPYMELPQPLPADWKLRILGAHNEENAALAAAALKALGLTESELKEGIESFEAVEGRLQFVREIRGVKIYNDNNATTPEATVAALRALDLGRKNIVLIAGGSDKGLNMQDLITEAQARCKNIFLLSGTGTDRIRSAIPSAQTYDGLERAVAAAIDEAQSGDVILFSPAFASFGPPPGGFKNEYDRNDQFMTLVRSL